MCARMQRAIRRESARNYESDLEWLGGIEYQATPQERNAALALNLDCLTKLGGCKDITEFLPPMWTHVSATLIRSQLLGESQRLEEAHQFPSDDDF